MCRTTISYYKLYKLFPKLIVNPCFVLIDTTKPEAKLILIIHKKNIYLKYFLKNNIKEYVTEFLQGLYNGMSQSHRSLL